MFPAPGYPTGLDPELDGWPGAPVIGPPVVQPLAFDPPTFIETPEYQKLGLEGPGSRYLWRTYGIPFPTETVDVRFLDRGFERTFPASDPERLRYFDEVRCLDIDPAAIKLTGTSFELVRVHLQKYGAGVVERLVTIFDDVLALDGNGDPLFDFGPLLGLRPCRLPLVHPDPAAGTLAMEFRLLVTEVPGVSVRQGAGFPGYQGPVPPSSIPADVMLRTSWRDLRYAGTRFADLLQYVTGANALVRLWVTFFAQPDRWRIRVGGRLGGYWNSAGRLGVARRSATQRTL